MWQSAGDGRKNMERENLLHLRARACHLKNFWSFTPFLELQKQRWPSCFLVWWSDCNFAPNSHPPGMKKVVLRWSTQLQIMSYDSLLTKESMTHNLQLQYFHHSLRLDVRGKITVWSLESMAASVQKLTWMGIERMGREMASAWLWQKGNFNFLSRKLNPFRHRIRRQGSHWKLFPSSNNPLFLACRGVEKTSFALKSSDETIPIFENCDSGSLGDFTK